MRPTAVLLLGLALLGSAAAAKTPCSYIVLDGNSVYGIAQEFGLTLDQVKASNPSVDNFELIRPGAVLALPCNGTATKGDTILDLLANRDDMQALFQAVVAANFTDLLADEKLEGTLFAPNDTAWEALLGRLNLTAGELLADKELLSSVLQYHLVPDKAWEAEKLENGLNLTTALEGDFLVVFKPNDTVRLETTSGQKVKVTDADLEAGDSLVHIVQSVLWPGTSLVELPEPSGDCVYEVQEGDFLFQIAKDKDTTVEQLLELNPALEPDGGASIKPGDKLVLFPSCAI